jgi:hypothetical protein
VNLPNAHVQYYANKSIHSAILYAEDNLMPLAYKSLHAWNKNK